ncbi:MAG: hypothetical protein ACT4P1_08485 [Sporichthyaceae bacterium]
MYRIETDARALEQVAALPAVALTPYAELLALLEVGPWSGQEYHEDLPEGPVRALHIGRHGEGLAFYLILDQQRRVIVLKVLWVG